MMNKFKNRFNKVVSNIQKQLNNEENPLKDVVINHFNKYGLNIEKDQELINEAKKLGLDEIEFRRYIQKQRAKYKTEKKEIIKELLDGNLKETGIIDKDKEDVKLRALSYGFSDNDFEEIFVNYIRSKKGFIKENTEVNAIRLIVDKAERFNYEVETNRKKRTQFWKKELKTLKEEVYQYDEENIEIEDAKNWWNKFSKTDKKEISSQFGISTNLFRGYQDEQITSIYYKQELEEKFQNSTQELRRITENKIENETKLLLEEKQKLQDIIVQLRSISNDYHKEFKISKLLKKVEVNANMDINVVIKTNIETNIVTNIMTDIKIDNDLLKEGMNFITKLKK